MVVIVGNNDGDDQPQHWMMGGEERKPHRPRRVQTPQPAGGTQNNRAQCGVMIYYIHKNEKKKYGKKKETEVRLPNGPPFFVCKAKRTLSNGR